MPALFEPLGPAATLVVQGANLVAAGHSPHQQWEVWDTPAFGRLYRLDGRIMASERDETICHTALVQQPARAHGAVHEVLVLGGGDGGSARQLLALPDVERIVVVELDPAVVALTRTYLPSICGDALDHPHVELRHADARDYLRDLPAERVFDLIVFDLTDADASAASLFGESFLTLCRTRLKPGGMLSLHLASPVHAPQLVYSLHARLRRLFGRVCVHEARIPCYGGRWSFAWASV